MIGLLQLLLFTPQIRIICPFQDGRALLSSGHNRGVSDTTRKHIRNVFHALRANPRVTVQRLDGLLSQIPRSENILLIHNEEGYNLLQKCVGINNLEMVRWCISRNIDINRGCCSLPLHIACLRGYEAWINDMSEAELQRESSKILCLSFQSSPSRKDSSQTMPPQ